MGKVAILGRSRIITEATSLTFMHCLRFSWELLPGGTAAVNKRGNTARIAEGYIPPTSPETPKKIKSYTQHLLNAIKFLKYSATNGVTNNQY